MAKLSDLNLDSIKNANGNEIPFVIVFTLLDEYIETFKREEKAWRNFEKQYQTDHPKDDYNNIEDISIDIDDEDEPFRDKPVAIITKESLSAISESDKAKFDFGIRVIDVENDVARVFSQEMLDYFKIDYVTKGVEFDDVESTLNEIMEQTKNLNSVANQQQETQTDQQDNKVEETVSNTQSSEEAQYETYTDGSDEESEPEATTDTTEVKTDSTEENTVDEMQEASKAASDEESEQNYKQNPTPIESVQQNTDEENKEIAEQNKHEYAFDLDNNNPTTPLEYAKQDLMHEIAEKINPVRLPVMNHIPDDTLGSLSHSKSYDKFVSLKQITEDKFIKRTESTEKALNNLRNEYINKIFNKLFRRLSVENDELLRKSDFTSEYSPFYEGYKNLKNEYQGIVDSLPETKHEQVEKNKKQHETNKNIYVERAAQAAAQEYDQKNHHLIDEKAQNYIDEIKGRADKEYQQGYKNIEQDSQNWYVQNFNTLVPKILQANQEDIEKASEDFTITIQQEIKELNRKNEEDINYLTKQFQDITYKEIETDKENEALINKKVHERTLEYTDFKHTIEKLEEETKRLREENKEAFENHASAQRDLLAERKRNEALEDALENRNIDMTQALDNYRHIQKLIANGDIEKLQQILDRDKVEPIKDSFVDKIKGLASIIAAAIIAIAIIIAAILFSTGGNDDQVSQSEVKSQVQQAVEANDKKHEKEKEASDARIQKLENDLKAEQSKSKKESSK